MENRSIRLDMLALAMVAAMSFIVVTVDASTKHVVGGSVGWTIPSNESFYSDWANKNKFNIGDTLVFNFSTGVHTVIKVPKSGYDACSTQSQIGSSLTTGPATVTISSAGVHYFVCGVTGHCSGGQKLAINVSKASTSSAPIGSPKPSATSPSSSSPSSSSPTFPATSSPTGSPGSSKSPSAGFRMNAGVATTLLIGINALLLLH